MKLLKSISFFLSLAVIVFLTNVSARADQRSLKAATFSLPSITFGRGIDEAGRNQNSCLFDKLNFGKMNASEISMKCGQKSTSRLLVNPIDFGAVCDGTTDDTVAFQSALNSIISDTKRPSALIIPGECKVGHLIYNAAKQGGLSIFGFGPTSELLLTDPLGGLTVVGTCGMTAERVFFQNFSMRAAAAKEIKFGFDLEGVAVFGFDNVSFDRGSADIDIGILGKGAQQGYIRGGYSYDTHTDVFLDDCVGNVGRVSSNGVDYGGGRTSESSTAAVDIEGGASDVWIRGLHHTLGLHSIIVNQTTGVGGSGPEYISDVHFEADKGAALKIMSGKVFGSEINDYDKYFAEISPNSFLSLTNSLINGSVKFYSGSSGTLSNNLLNSAVTNKAGDRLTSINNFGNGAPHSDIFYRQGASFNSNKQTPGDIVSFRANPSISGSWGISVSGAGAGRDTYLRLNDVLLTGSTNTGSLRIKSSFDAGDWMSVTPEGVRAQHFLAEVGAKPSIRSCGPSATVTGSDVAGMFTTGEGNPKSCQLRFYRRYDVAAYCTVTPMSDPGKSSAYISNSNVEGFTVNFSTPRAKAKYSYTCLGE